MANKQSTGLSNDAKTVITILCLLFVYPAGFILMWLWKLWPKWVRIIISLPVIIVVFAFIVVIITTILQNIIAH